jgi:NhaP-type Na+/H+ or K+/H+ antiporter
MGYGTTFNQIIFMAYAGLRGAIGITLCLILMKNDNVDTAVSDLVMFHVSCLVMLTLLINGTTVGPIVRWLGLQTSSLVEKKNIVDFIGDFKTNKKTILDDMRLNMPYLRGVDW